MNNQLLTVSSPPHIYGTDTTTRCMRDVVIALTPACIFGIYFYGIPALFTIAVAVISAVLAEFFFQKVARKKVTITDFSAVITGILLALNLPPDIPFWVTILGSIFAIVAVKQFFGGLGQNFMNPALAARAFLLISFPVHMTNWRTDDAVSGATYLEMVRTTPNFIPHISDYATLFFGKIGGCIGETSAFAIIAGGLYLIFRGVINWKTPVFYIGSFSVFSLMFGMESYFSGYLIFEVLSGGLLLGAFFMATDYATCPITPIGKIIMGVGCGFLTALIRVYGGYPEGVSYAILIMNAFVPLIDRYVRPRIYGGGKKK